MEPSESEIQTSPIDIFKVVFTVKLVDAQSKDAVES